MDWVSASGPELYERAILDGRQLVKPMVASSARGAAILTAQEVGRLRKADLFYVSEQMTTLAVAAGRSLPEFTLMPEDLPSPSGLVYFAKPIAAVDYSQWYENEAESPIVAASWGHWTGNNPAWVNGGVWVTWYADRDANFDSALERGAGTRGGSRPPAGSVGASSWTTSPRALSPQPRLVSLTRMGRRPRSQRQPV
ncbi:hypothetical protein [Phytohabitans houttuyneae]|uniref:hypothetical protein n=1 Tax=Phytohabitans houttuyneae TaxID=1076126 RepID=UPI001C49A463|nr:hypothetical protein [Phytohabitans houttuyneae]